MINTLQEITELDEKEVYEAIWSLNRLHRPTQFKVRRIKTTGKWIVLFQNNANTRHVLVKKIRGNVKPKIREFSRLNGVQKWMQKMEIAEFTVLL